VVGCVGGGGGFISGSPLDIPPCVAPEGGGSPPPLLPIPSSGGVRGLPAAGDGVPEGLRDPRSRSPRGRQDQLPQVRTAPPVISIPAPPPSPLPPPNHQSPGQTIAPSPRPNPVLPQVRTVFLSSTLDGIKLVAASPAVLSVGRGKLNPLLGNCLKRLIFLR